MRAEQRKQDERRKEDLATRHRILAAILDRASAPLAKADLELVAREFANRLPQDYKALLSQRHSSTAANAKSPKQGTDSGHALKNLDETGFSRLLVEMALLDAAHSIYARDGAERLEAVAKRYRIKYPAHPRHCRRRLAAKRKKHLDRAKSKSKPA